MQIGSKGLLMADIIIPQSTTLAFAVIHTDEDGQVIDHSESTLHMAIQSKDGDTTVDWSQYCSATDEAISVTIPDAATDDLDVGVMRWDLIATMTSGASVRLLYGNCKIVDTYALDEEE